MIQPGSLLAVALIAGCVDAPRPLPAPPAPSAAPAPGATASASAEPAKAPCAEAAEARAEAQRAFDTGRLLLARRRLARAARLCPAEAGAGRALDAQVALALGDTAGLAPSKHPEADYRVAARAFLDGKLDEAWSGALSVALAGGDFDSSAFVIAARVAEARHDAPQARRMYARAYQAECSEDCGLAVEPPNPRFASLNATYPGLRPFWPTCVSTSEGGSQPPEVLTPDGRFYLQGIGGLVQVRALPSRILVDWIDVKPDESKVVCAGPSARWFFVQGNKQVQLVPAGGGAPVHLRTPRPFLLLVRNDVLLAEDGNLLVPDFEGFDTGRTWYRASPRAPSLRPLPALHSGYVPAVLPNGDLLSIADRRTDQEGRYLGTFARFDGKTGRLIARIGPAPESAAPWLAASPSGKTAYALAGSSPREILMLDLASGATRSVPISDGDPVGLVAPTSVVVNTKNQITLIDVAAGTTTPGGAVTAPPDSALAAFGGPDISISRDGAAVRLARVVGDVHAALWIHLTPDGKSGIAIDDKGYYETFGEGADLVRRASGCHGERPLEMCADRWEEPGLAERFRRGDLGYRDP